MAVGKVRKISEIFLRIKFFSSWSNIVSSIGHGSAYQYKPPRSRFTLLKNSIVLLINIRPDIGKIGLLHKSIHICFRLVLDILYILLVVTTKVCERIYLKWPCPEAIELYVLLSDYPSVIALLDIIQKLNEELQLRYFNPFLI